MFKTKNVWYANLGKHFAGMVSYQKIFWFDKVNISIQRKKKTLGNETFIEKLICIKFTGAKESPTQ